ncbi:MAG: hypothetical protein PHW22_05015 [Bacilli bacterium]|nr:hypothetical protein [Bacilli bacterium]
MKSVYDRIWEWMKSTAWFQVVLLVGVVVAVVLSISPITTAISNAIDDSKDSKYYDANRINYNTMMDKINGLDNGSQDDFAVLFMNDTTADCKDIEQGIEDYEETKNAVKIYNLNVSVYYENKANYDADENWYNYYAVNEAELTNVREATINVYEKWQEYCKSNIDEVEQDSDYQDANSIATYINQPTLVWFKADAEIDPEVRDLSKINDNTTTVDDTLDMHAAKVYLTIQDSDSSSTETDIKTLSGLQKFFGNSSLA